jgi:hypothetical protein
MTKSPLTSPTETMAEKAGNWIGCEQGTFILLGLHVINPSFGFVFGCFNFVAPGQNVCILQNPVYRHGYRWLFNI